MGSKLTLENIKLSANMFARRLSTQPIPELFGATDGKIVGTYVEQTFLHYLAEQYNFVSGNAAIGIDLPDLLVDIKATSTRQPQSSCPFRDAGQKIYGLGYHLLVFEYERRDDHTFRITYLNIKSVTFIDKSRTGDLQTTFGINEILRRNSNLDDIVAFLEERNLPLDEIGRRGLAERILSEPPQMGYLTISNALQWRLQYTRAIGTAVQGDVEGVEKLYV